MKPGSLVRMLMFVSLAIAAVCAGRARAEEIAQITGVHWTKSTEDQKKAYLIGIANISQIELAYAGTPSDDHSILPRMARGLKGQTLDSVREGLNKWYAANPGRLDRPVIETIWYEMVVPGLAKNN
ncbi:MAG TPA: hypothetical protein VFV97_03495 [Rhodanobacteraceae bacterium]|nr:hypothetical protein [Rhodanobacteraceae bacterium]